MILVFSSEPGSPTRTTVPRQHIALTASPITSIGIFRMISTRDPTETGRSETKQIPAEEILEDSAGRDGDSGTSVGLTHSGTRRVNRWCWRALTRRGAAFLSREGRSG